MPNKGKRKPNTLTIEGVLLNQGYIVLNGDFMWMDRLTLHNYPKVPEAGSPSQSPNLSKDPSYSLSLIPPRLDQSSYHWVVSDVQPGTYTDLFVLSVEHLCYGKGAAQVPMLVPSAVRWGDVVQKGTVRMATQGEVAAYYRSLRRAVADFLMELSMGSPGPAGGGFGPDISPELQLWLKGMAPLYWEGRGGVGCLGDYGPVESNLYMHKTMPDNYCPAPNVPAEWRKSKDAPLSGHLRLADCVDFDDYKNLAYQIRGWISEHYHGDPISIELYPNGSCRFARFGVGIATSEFAPLGFFGSGPQMGFKAVDGLFAFINVHLPPYTGPRGL